LYIAGSFVSQDGERLARENEIGAEKDAAAAETAYGEAIGHRILVLVTLRFLSL
jgi:hypothetical protein